MSKKIFVANFSFEVGDENLKEHFSTIGTVLSARVMKDNITGKSRGFGFVEMASEDDAKRATQELDGQSWDGRVIKVTEDVSDKRKKEASAGRIGGINTNQGSYEDRNSGPKGYFRAQPLELTLKKKKKIDPFEEDTTMVLDYKNARLLEKFTSERGRILPRRMTGLHSANQRHVKTAIKRAQHLGLLSYRGNE